MSEHKTNHKIEIADDSSAGDWQQFVLTHAPAHHAFDWRWREILHRTFGHKPFYLLARSLDDNSVQGVLPLFLVKSALFGRSLISVPYLNAGGLVALNSEALHGLSNKARELGQSKDARYLELRARDAISELDSDYEMRSHKISMLLKLNSDPEEMFRTFPAKLRSQIRRPSKSGIVADVLSGAEVCTDDISMYYAVFSRNMRDLGTPVYPRRLFAETLRVFGADAKLIVIRKERTPMACGLTVKFKESVEIPWASSLRKFNSLSPNMLLYWSAIKDACTNDASFFDFGRSNPKSGTFRFKKQWGAEPLELHWYYAKELGNIPDINPNSSSFSTLVKVWQQLPLPLANAVGPWITKSLP